MLAYQPSASLDIQLFLPDIIHSVTLLVGAGPVLMRQSTYALLVNALHSLASTQPTGEMDGPVLVELLAMAQEAAMLENFKLVKVGNELLPMPKEGDPLNAVEAVAGLLSKVVIAAAPSIGELISRLG
jgi:neurofibromin 1